MANPRPARHALALATLRMRSPQKAIELGNSLRAAGDVDRRAIGAGGTAERASFALNRAYELQRRGDAAAAVASYEEAVDLGDPVLSPRAARMLASLVEGD